ncbi:MAG: hypothetical protein D6808_05275, partial [Candidatus Dadabacteria bacterium]
MDARYSLLHLLNQCGLIDHIPDRAQFVDSEYEPIHLLALEGFFDERDAISRVAKELGIEFID